VPRAPSLVFAGFAAFTDGRDGDAERHGRAGHNPRAAFASSPPRTAAARQAQIRFSVPSPRTAAKPGAGALLGGAEQRRDDQAGGGHGGAGPGSCGVLRCGKVRQSREPRLLLGWARQDEARFCWGVRRLSELTGWHPRLELRQSWHLMDYHPAAWPAPIRVLRHIPSVRAQSKIGHFHVATDPAGTATSIRDA